MKLSFTLAAVGVALLCAEAAAQEMRIGFINTTTGGGAIIGKPLENGFRLGLAAGGWKKDGDKFAGVVTRVFFADDQVKPDAGLREAEKLLKQDQVHIVAGIIWGNVFNAVSRPVFEAGKLMIGGVSGQAHFAGAGCNTLFVSASHQNDQIAEATGEILVRRGVKRVALLAPNYQAGKEFLDAFERTYTGGTVAERLLFKLGESDFQAEIGKVRSLAPDAVVLFAPGAMGISFLRQWNSAGLRDKVRVYSFYSVDESNLSAIGDAAQGVFDTNNWTPELDNPMNRELVKAHMAAYNAKPSIYAVYGWDVATVIATGLKHTGGKFEDAAAMAKAVRQHGIASPRGDLRYAANGFLIQPYYLREVAPGPDGKLAILRRETISSKPDSFWEKCPADRRI